MITADQLLDDLLRLANVSVLQGVCLRLGVDYERLWGVTLADKGQALVEMLGANGRLPELASELVQLQPQLADKYNAAQPPPSHDWIDDVAVGENPLSDTMVTMTWGDTDEATPASSWFNPFETEVRRQGNEEVTANVGQLALRPTPPNPYQPGTPVTTSQMFFGRQVELKRLQAALAQRQSVALVGPVYMGKSSLLGQLSARVDKRRLWATADLQAVTSLPELLAAVFRQWVEPLGQVSSVPELADGAALAHWVRALNVKGFAPALGLDNLALASPLAGGLWPVWEPLLAEGLLTLVLVAERPLIEHNLTPGWHRLFQQLDVGLLTETAVYNLLTQPNSRAGLILPAGLAEQLYKLAGPHPLYLQIAGYHLFAGLGVQSYSWAAVRDAFLAQAQPYWHALWQGLSAGQQAVLLAALSQAPLPGAMRRPAQALVSQGVLLFDRGEYRPFSHGFANWVLQLNRTPPSIHESNVESDAPRHWLNRWRRGSNL